MWWQMHIKLSWQIHLLTCLAGGFTEAVYKPYTVTEISSMQCTMDQQQQNSYKIYRRQSQMISNWQYTQRTQHTWYSSTFFNPAAKNGLNASMYFKKFSPSTAESTHDEELLHNWTTYSIHCHGPFQTDSHVNLADSAIDHHVTTTYETSRCSNAKPHGTVSQLHFLAKIFTKNLQHTVLTICEMSKWKLENSRRSDLLSEWTQLTVHPPAHRQLYHSMCSASVAEPSWWHQISVEHLQPKPSSEHSTQQHTASLHNAQ